MIRPPLAYLFDEHVDRALIAAVHQIEPAIPVRRVGDDNAPRFGASDLELLEWCDQHGFILVTNNRRSMPVHLAERINTGDHTPGIFILGRLTAIGEAAADLVVVALASREGEYADSIRHLPLSI